MRRVGCVGCVPVLPRQSLPQETSQQIDLDDLNRIIDYSFLVNSLDYIDQYEGYHSLLLIEYDSLDVVVVVNDDDDDNDDDLILIELQKADLMR